MFTQAADSAFFFQGRIIQSEIDRKIAQAILRAVTIQLGGEQGKTKGFGQCLVIQADNDSSLGSIRSQLGNALASVAQTRGLRSIGLIAYREVIRHIKLHTYLEMRGSLCGVSCRQLGYVLKGILNVLLVIDIKICSRLLFLRLSIPMTSGTTGACVGLKVWQGRSFGLKRISLY